MMLTKLTLPLTEQQVLNLHAGDMLILSGHLYTARDAAHKRMDMLLKTNQPLPFSLKGESIYYVGATPAREGYAVGSAGPTSAYRMDDYTPLLLQNGLRVMIGKGKRSPKVIEAMIQHKAVYLGVTGGIGALIAKTIKQCELVAFEDLLSEAIYRYEIENFPAIVLIDAYGKNLYEMQS